jgi:Zn-dependent peptidase ImmA (M78 family)
MENEMQVVANHIARAPVDAPAVDLSAVFDDLGVLYEERPIWGSESGWIERDGETFKVVVNAAEPEKRRRFTAAHELAHFLLHRDLMDHGGRMNRHTDHLFGEPEPKQETAIKPHHEVQANRLAAQILMPGRRVSELVKAGKTVEELAQAFHVSRAAMEIRLKTLGLAK